MKHTFCWDIGPLSYKARVQQIRNSLLDVTKEGTFQLTNIGKRKRNRKANRIEWCLAFELRLHYEHAVICMHLGKLT